MLASLPPPLNPEDIEGLDLDPFFVHFLTTVTSFGWLTDLKRGRKGLCYYTLEDEEIDAEYFFENCVEYNIETNKVFECRYDGVTFYDSFERYYYDSFKDYLEEKRTVIVNEDHNDTRYSQTP